MNQSETLETTVIQLNKLVELVVETLEIMRSWRKRLETLEAKVEALEKE